MALAMTGILTQNLANYQKTVEHEKSVATSALSPAPLVLGDGTVLSMDHTHDMSKMSPEARADAAAQRSLESQERFENAVKSSSPLTQHAARAAREEAAREAAKAKSQGKPYDEQAAYTVKMMKYADDMLTTAETPGQMRNASMGDPLDVKGLGEVFHSGAESLRDRSLQRELEANVPKKSLNDKWAEYINR